MDPRPFCRASTLVALLAYILVAGTATAQEAPPSERDKRIAFLFRAGMTALARAEQADGEEARQALYDQAIVVFRAVLINRPELIRVRLELARTFFLKGQDGLARRHFELVLAGGVPPPVAANIHRFLSVMRARKRWSGYFGAAFAPDSNLNAASESETIYLELGGTRLPFRRQGDFGAQSGLSVSVWGGGEYQQPLSERLRLRVGADVAQREYGGSDFDQFFVAAHAGPRWLAGPITELSLLAIAQRQWLGGEPYVGETGVRLELDRRLTRRMWTRGTAAYRERDHQQRDFLDGPQVGFNLSLAWTPAPVLRVHMTVGYERDHAASEHWRNLGRWVRVHAAQSAARLHLGYQRPDSADVLPRQRSGAPDTERPQAV